jgi:DNA mismatch repair protein MutS
MRPGARSADINRRLDEVETFITDRMALAEGRSSLGGVRDLERLMAKVMALRANPRDMKALAASLAPLPDLKRNLASLGPRLAGIESRLTCEDEIVALLERAIADDPPVALVNEWTSTEGDSATRSEERRIKADDTATTTSPFPTSNVRLVPPTGNSG